MRLSLFILLFCVQGLMAQNNLIVFSEDGEKFTLYVSGEQVNDDPTSRVVKTGISEGNVSLRLELEGDIAPDVKSNVAFFEANTERVFRLKMSKRGYKLQFFGENPISAEPELVVEEVVYAPVPAYSEPVTYTTEVETQVIETSTEVNVDHSESMSIDVGAGGISMSIDVEIDDSLIDGDYIDEESSTSYTSTTTTTVTETEGGQMYVDHVLPPTTYESVDPCKPALDDVSTIKRAMEEEAFADDRMNVARQALKSACIKVEGVMELAELFQFEDDRLDFVKYAYDRTIDTENFYQVNSVFTFSDSKEALNSFLERK